MSPSTALVPVPEFGPFDVVSDWAHGLYSANLDDEAVLACRQARMVVDPAGDRTTSLYLRYIECLAHEDAARWALLRRQSEELLDWLRPSDGPYWRAKALGLHCQALLHDGMFAAALDGLAEAYGTVMDLPDASYNRGSACQAVSVALQTALLFGPAADLLRESATTPGVRPEAMLHAHLHRAVTEGSWGLMLELVGRPEQARRHYVRCASSALQVEKVPGGDREPYGLQGRGMLEFAYQRLRVAHVDLGLLERHAEATPGRQGVLTRLAVASVHARAGRAGQARAVLAEVRASAAARDREAVAGWTADAWLADLEEHEGGASEASRRWRAAAVRSLDHLWRDRAGRFEHLLARRRLAQLSADTQAQDLRLWEDALTCVGNRRLLDALLADEAGRRRPVLFVDVDAFKAVNDRFGHEIGDEVLRRIAVVLRDVSRSGDVPVRYGGDEFVLVLAEGADATAAAGRVAAAVRAVPWEDLAPGLRVEVTVGASAGGPGALARADADVLAAKAARRARVRPPRRPR